MRARLRTPNHVRSWLAAPLGQGGLPWPPVSALNLPSGSTKSDILVSIACWSSLQARRTVTFRTIQGQRPFLIGRGASLRSSSLTVLVRLLRPTTKDGKQISRGSRRCSKETLHPLLAF